MTIQIKPSLRVKSSYYLHGIVNPFYKKSWMELDIDRIEISVNNSVDDYQQPDEETTIMQITAGKQLINFTGHFTDDSDFVGSGVTEKAKNLVLAGRYWYFGIRAKATTFPQLHWNNKIYDMLFQKVIIIDTAASGNELIHYNIGMIIKEGV